MGSCNTSTSQIISMLPKFNTKFLPLLLKVALCFENSQIRSTWNKAANIHPKMTGIVTSPPFSQHAPCMENPRISRIT